MLTSLPGYKLYHYSLLTLEVNESVLILEEKGDKTRQKPHSLKRMKVFIFLALVALSLAGIPRPDEAREDAPQPEVQSPELKCCPDTLLRLTTWSLMTWTLTTT